MDFYNTIYNAIHSYIKEKDIDLSNKDLFDVSIELSEKYMEIVEIPLTDAIHDALLEAESK